MLRSPVLLAALADAAVPAIRPVKVEGRAVPAGAVYQSADVTGHDGRVWIVRSALTGAAGAELAASDALVQLLDRRVPFEVPRVAGSARPKDGPAIAVYPRLRGNDLDWNELRGRSDAARALGIALAQLHDVDPRVVEEAGLPSYDADTYRQRLAADVDRAAATKLVPAALLERWREAIGTPALWRFSTTVTHGPLRGEDVRVDEGEVSGMSGWEHAGVADPARDFALLWNTAPQPAFDTVFEAYAAHREDRPDQNLERRIRLMGELELAYSLLQSRTMGEDELVRFHTAALETLARDVEGDRSLVPPERKGGIVPMPLDAVDPSDMEVIDDGDADEEGTTVEIPVRPGEPEAKDEDDAGQHRDDRHHDDRHHDDRHHDDRNGTEDDDGTPDEDLERPGGEPRRGATRVDDNR